MDSYKEDTKYCFMVCWKLCQAHITCEFWQTMLVVHPLDKNQGPPHYMVTALARMRSGPKHWEKTSPLRGEEAELKMAKVHFIHISGLAPTLVRFRFINPSIQPNFLNSLWAPLCRM
jgi:hypothetical protein